MESGFESLTWQEILTKSYCSIGGLSQELGLSGDEVRTIDAITEKYPMCVNPYYYSLIDPDNPDDPVCRMCIPDPVEFSDGGVEDTSGEASNTVVQGMQHKYRQTTLILSTNQCAMYCRHCFRKRMVGVTEQETAQHLDEMISYVRAHPEIDNVLVSGGDAFMNSNDILRRYLEGFLQLPAVRFIRFGTRTPVVLPQRITGDPELTALLSEYSRKKQIYIVTQFNHPKEITDYSKEAVRQLQAAGCIVRNQTVLLNGVNNDPDVLSGLLNTLSGTGVIPYYVFQCRPAAGVMNRFQIPLIQGLHIFNDARTLMNGMAKSARYVLSHPTGKIEILGMSDGGEMVFRYHQSKYREDESRLFSQPVTDTQCWLNEIASRYYS
jgi:lysine 2,3-aminomutase